MERNKAIGEGEIEIPSSSNAGVEEEAAADKCEPLKIVVAAEQGAKPTVDSSNVELKETAGSEEAVPDGSVGGAERTSSPINEENLLQDTSMISSTTTVDENTELSKKSDVYANANASLSSITDEEILPESSNIDVELNTITSDISDDSLDMDAESETTKANVDVNEFSMSDISEETEMGSDNNMDLQATTSGMLKKGKTSGLEIKMDLKATTLSESLGKSYNDEIEKSPIEEPIVSDEDLLMLMDEAELSDVSASTSLELEENVYSDTNENNADAEIRNEKTKTPEDSEEEKITSSNGNNEENEICCDDEIIPTEENMGMIEIPQIEQIESTAEVVETETMEGIEGNICTDNEENMGMIENPQLEQIESTAEVVETETMDGIEGNICTDNEHIEGTPTSDEQNKKQFDIPIIVGITNDEQQISDNTNQAIVDDTIASSTSTDEMVVDTSVDNSKNINVEEPNSNIDNVDNVQGLTTDLSEAIDVTIAVSSGIDEIILEKCKSIDQETNIDNVDPVQEASTDDFNLTENKTGNDILTKDITDEKIESMTTIDDNITNIKDIDEKKINSPSTAEEGDSQNLASKQTEDAVEIKESEIGYKPITDEKITTIIAIDDDIICIKEMDDKEMKSSSDAKELDKENVEIKETKDDVGIKDQNIIPESIEEVEQVLNKETIEKSELPTTIDNVENNKFPQTNKASDNEIDIKKPESSIANPVSLDDVGIKDQNMIPESIEEVEQVLNNETIEKSELPTTIDNVENNKFPQTHTASDNEIDIKRPESSIANSVSLDDVGIKDQNIIPESIEEVEKVLNKETIEKSELPTTIDNDENNKFPQTNTASDNEIDIKKPESSIANSVSLDDIGIKDQIIIPESIEEIEIILNKETIEKSELPTTIDDDENKKFPQTNIASDNEIDIKKPESSIANSLSLEAPNVESETVSESNENVTFDSDVEMKELSSNDELTKTSNSNEHKSVDCDEEMRQITSTNAKDTTVSDVEMKQNVTTTTSDIGDIENIVVVEISENEDVQKEDNIKELVKPVVTKTLLKQPDMDSEKNKNNSDLVNKPAKETIADEEENCEMISILYDKNIFFDKDCVNYECSHISKRYFRAPLFALNFYKITKKFNKPQFVCEICFDNAQHKYEHMCSLLKQEQPLLLADIPKRHDFVEIIDSSDEEDTTENAVSKDDEDYIDKESLRMIESDLNNIIIKVLSDVNIRNQCTWAKTILQQKLQNVEKASEEITADLRKLQTKADHMHNSLYQCAKIRLRHSQAIDLNSGRPYDVDCELIVPPIGELQRRPIELDGAYLGVNTKAICAWVDCRVIELNIDNDSFRNVKFYRVRFDGNVTKILSDKNLAYLGAPPVRLQIGTRVVALFNTSALSRQKKARAVSAFYPGVVAEPLKQSNKFRYLIFFDDGYAQYVYHNDVRLVCNAAENVWEDVHPGSKDFIHHYLTQYSVNRPMVQTSCGQTMLTETNGKWMQAKVIDVDCSLVRMQFSSQPNKSEWLYRGSTRLGPVFKESQKPLQRAPATPRLPRRFEPFIRYTQDEESSARSAATQPTPPPPPQSPQKPPEVRSVAKKSIGRQDTIPPAPIRPPTVKHLNNSTIFVDDDIRQGRVYNYTPKKAITPKTYVNHMCSPTCLRNITNTYKGFNPLAKPLLSGWERIILKQKHNSFIAYVAPCGRRLKDMDAVRTYLRTTKTILNVDNFDFHPDISCLSEYASENVIVQNRDLSNGQEEVAIPCVNNFDNTFPPDCVYSAKRIPTKGVNLNLDEEFLAGCDCEDDCSDKSKCACWQQTLAGAKYIEPGYPTEFIGYQYKRLHDSLTAGIYECNPRCKCSSSCLNRVVQHPISVKLQVFKTRNRGWGIRCLNDVPKGGFVCVYAGHLLTENDANEGGTIAGDEYFAELDYIESAEKTKEGYESEAYVSGDDEKEDNYSPDQDEEDDDDFNPNMTNHSSQNKRRLRSRKGKQAANAVEEEPPVSERRVINFEPNTSLDNNDDQEEGRNSKSVRKLFGKDEACYVMDAKISGNVGRYFNHSCAPNLFVQNVFVDTHDLRFPWVAFFAVSNIRAGSELTWNYSYEVGSVPGKVLYCECGASTCRGRLL